VAYVFNNRIGLGADAPTTTDTKPLSIGRVLVVGLIAVGGLWLILGKHGAIPRDLEVFPRRSR